MGERCNICKDNPLWYKDAVIYELHIKSFFDSNGDGVGDIAGLIERLDYLQDLGVTVLWLLPFYPSPLRDDGYDIADYCNINTDYGDMEDFRKLLQEAHSKGMRIVTELVLNHTSDQHEWFQRARRSPVGSQERDYYVWSDTSDTYADARIIFKDFETSNWSWDPVAGAYYWHRFYHHQPDLNYENPDVHCAMLEVIDFWLELGVDGVRLDAVPYLYEKEGTNCENLPETYTFLKTLRSHIDAKFSDRMLLAEANQWPEDAVMYFGDGDSCHMCFHFPLMPRMFMALQMEDRYPIIDILEQTPSIPSNAQWAVFLRNHDELTLEMVTDEERDYMYRMYARDPKARINLGIRRRLAPLLGNDRKKIELLNILLFSMPGTPVLYYGDEIGMGDNYYLGDRDGVRTPMQWSADRNAGFSRSNPQQLFLPVVIDPEYHYEATNVENQQSNKSSLLWWMKRIIALRKQHVAFGRGTITFLRPENPKVLTFIRSYENENLLVVCNLSRYAQAVSLDLTNFVGYWPEELFSRVRFPQIGSGGYVLTLNPHGYYIFILRPEKIAIKDRAIFSPPVLPETPTGRFLGTDVREALCKEILPQYLLRRGLLQERNRQIRSVSILEAVPVGKGENVSWILIVETQFLEGPPAWNTLLVTLCARESAVAQEKSDGVLCFFEGEEQFSALVEGIPSGTECGGIIELIATPQTITGRFGKLIMRPAGDLSQFMKSAGTSGSWIDTGEVAALLCGDVIFCKIFCKMGEGVNPDAEILRHLYEKVGFAHVPRYMGELRYVKSAQESFHIAVLSEHIRVESDVWAMANDALGRYLDAILARKSVLDTEILRCSSLRMPPEKFPAICHELLTNADVEFFRLLGKRIGELHLALSDDVLTYDFMPESFSTLYQRSVYQGMQSRVKRVLDLLDAALPKFTGKVGALAKEVVEGRKYILRHLREFLSATLWCNKIRVHGNLHLGNVYYTGKDVIFYNFEGKSAKSLSESRIKRSGLQDIGDILRSLDHVARSSLSQGSVLRPEDRLLLKPWAEVWQGIIAQEVMQSYLATVQGSLLVPESREGLTCMLESFLLEKVFLELAHAMRTPDNTMEIPLQAIVSFLHELPAYGLR